MGLFSSGGSSKSVSGDYADLIYAPQDAGLTTNYQQGQAQVDQALAPDSTFNTGQQASNDAWVSLLSGAENPYLTGMASSAMSQLTRQFNEQIMPGLLGGGNQAGQLGSDRYSFLQNSAVDTAARAFGDVQNEIYGNMANLGIAGQSNAINQTTQMGTSQFAPLLAQSSILGKPTVLDQGSYAWSKSKGAEKGILGDIAGMVSVGVKV